MPALTTTSPIRSRLPGYPIRTLKYSKFSLNLPRLDRYLALRGIRHWDHRTFQGRVLTVQEVWALFVVAGWTPPKGG